MDILESALAFTVVMILFSTITTGLTEFVVKLLALRPRMLMLQMAQFIEQEIKPRFIDALAEHNELAGDDEKWKAFATQLNHRLTDNPLLSADPSAKASGNILARGLHHRAEVSNRVDELTTYAFLQRLARSPVGEVICKMTGSDQQAVHAVQRATLQDLVRTFERYTAARQESLRKKMQTVSIVVAIVLAFMMNIDAWRLFSHLLDHPEAREDLIAEVDAAHSASQDAQQGLSETLFKLQHAEAPYTNTEGQHQLQEELQQQFDDLKHQLQPLLHDTALPIGPEQFPYACLMFNEDHINCNSMMDSSETRTERALALLGWLFNVLAAGLLIGLGGPFWYKVFASLSNLAQVLRAVGGGNRHSEVMAQNDPGQPATEAALSEAKPPATGGAAQGDIVSVFYTAAGRTGPSVAGVAQSG